MKDYKRLTTRNEKGEWTIEPSEELKLMERNLSADDFVLALFDQIAQRLCDIEDKIDDGTLFELPCKVGDMLYEVIEGMPIQEWKVESICFNMTYPKGVIWAERTSDFAHWKFWAEDCGTKWFNTKSEAEKRLEEIRSGNENEN